MTPQLLLSPTSFTTFSHLIERIREKKTSDPMIPITILLPTAGVMQDIQGQMGDTMGVYLYQFYRLGNTVLDEAGTPIHEINDTAVRRLIKRILAELNAEGKLTTFDPVREKPGFVEVTLDWLREMKSQGIFPEQYAEYAQVEQYERDLQLAELYLRYQAFLQERNYSDADGLLWVAAEALEGDPNLFQREGPLYVLGFDQFTPVQIRLLRQLSNRFAEFRLYLLWDQDRAEDSPALVRLKRTRDELLANIPFETVALQEEQDNSRPLTHLHLNLFEVPEKQPVGGDAVKLIETPSREIEVHHALREAKRMLIDGVSPSDIAILTPNKQAYLPIIRTASTEYGIPVNFERPLVENPAVSALIKLLSLPGSFSWQAVFETLRSPYFRQFWLTEGQIDLLDHLSRERPVIGGIDQWQFALRPLGMELEDLEDEDLRPPPLVAELPPEELGEIEAGLIAFFEHVSPPETGTYREYTWWLQTAIVGYFPEEEGEDDQAVEPEATLDMLGCCRNSAYSQRDLQALDLVMAALRRLLASAEIVSGEEEVAWETYRDELIGLLKVLHIPPDPLQSSVRFDRLEGGRSRLVDYLFVLGLSEGEFPRRPAPDVFYTPAEREEHPLPVIRYSAADDASLWWQVIGNVRRQLLLSRPYIDDNGAPWQPSPYREAVQACFMDLQPEVIRIAEHPGPDNAASRTELLVALTQEGARSVPGELQSEWDFVGKAESIMRWRADYDHPGEFEGVLGAASLKAELAERYGSGHIWSVSRLNRYANCPYGFFAEYVLKLEARNDPEEGFDALQRGSILHAILEHLYAALTKENIPPVEANLDLMINLLQQSCEFVFTSAPQRYGFRPGALWGYEQEELSRMVKALVTWECRGNGTDPEFLPYLLEVRFGFGREGKPALDIAGDFARFRLHGIVDRLDRDREGNLRVIDYKSGSTAYSRKDLEKGLALQTALYALAADQFWVGKDSRVLESQYWLIPKREASGKLGFSGSLIDDLWVQTAVQQAALSVSLVRVGVFPSAPAKPALGGRSCRDNCDYAPICRVSRQSYVKGRRTNWA